MAGVYTPLLRLLRQAITSNPNFWGAVFNTSVVGLLDTAIAGTSIVSLTSGSASLTTGLGVADTARAAVIALTGAPAPNGVLVVPATDKLYIIYNASSNPVVVKTAFDTGITITASNLSYLLVDGTNLRVREIGFSTMYALLGLNGVSGLNPFYNVPWSNGLGSVIVTAGWKESNICSLYMGSSSMPASSADLFFPLFSYLSTDYQCPYIVQQSIYVKDAGVLVASTMTIDAKGSGVNVVIAKNDGTPWGLTVRRVWGGQLISYSLVA